MEDLESKTTLSLHDAARLMARGGESIHDIEVRLARAVEHGELRANVKRWATEQWDGRQLPGNLNRLETLIDRADLDVWRNGAAP